MSFCVIYNFGKLIFYQFNYLVIELHNKIKQITLSMETQIPWALRRPSSVRLNVAQTSGKTIPTL